MSIAAGSLEVLRAAKRKRVPWKNGGGFTREVAASPAGSDLAGFDWRVSIAEIHRPGPFSLFDGIDRHLAVLAGRLSLAIEGRPATTLTPESDAVAFPGDIAVAAEPLGAPVTDLNVMTRRTRCAARLRRSGAGQSVIEQRADTALLVALTELLVACEGSEIELMALDALRIGRALRCSITSPSGPAAFYLIEISALRGLPEARAAGSGP